MAASAWVPYNTFKLKLGQALVDLSGGTFYMALFTSASNAATATLSAFSQLTNEVTEANGYSSSGVTGASADWYTWGVGASASEMRFDGTASVWNAAGGSISNIKYAVIWLSGGALVAYSQLSTSEFDVTTGNSLTITPSANGIFELN